MTRVSILHAMTCALALAAAGIVLPGCDAFGRSKVAHGQLYHSGDGNYDPYFESVHREQVAAEGWPDDKKGARRPLVTVLSLTPSASDDTLLSATRERVTKAGRPDGALAGAVEETKRGEQERAQKMKTTSTKLEELAKQGKQLEAEAKKAYENRGAEKADEKKSDKARELNRELSASVDVLTSLSRDAKSAAKSAEDFIDDLGRALEGKETPKRARSDDGRKSEETKRPEEPKKPEEPKSVETKKPEEPKKAEPKKPEGRKPESAPPPPPPAAKPKPAPPPPAEKPAEKPVDKAAEKPPEKPKPPDEVFNP